MSEWEMVRLGDVVCDKIEIISKNDSGIIEYIDISAVDNTLKKITVINKIPIVDAPSRAKQKISYNDILVSTVRPNLNAVAMNLQENNIQRVASTGYCVLRCKKMINPLYLFSFCKTNTFINQLIKVAKGASYPAVSDKDIKNLLIPLPPLEKQQEIAHQLDEISELIALRKEQIKKLDLLVKAKFVEMFGDPVENPMGWEVDVLKNVTFNFNKLRKPLNENERQLIQGIYPYYGATGIVDYINDYKLDGDYLLISEDGKALELRNKNIAFFASGKFWVNNHSHIMKNNEKTNMYFLRNLINNMDISEYVTGIDQKKLNKENLDKIGTILPPLPLQEQFAQYVQTVEETKKEMEEGLVKMELLYRERMQRWFG